MPYVLKVLSFAVLAVVACVSSALAHVGGHAVGFTGGLAHPFGGLDHVLAMVAVGLWASQLGGRALWLLPAIFAAVMAVGAIMGAGGVALPAIELGIGGSVVVLGVAVAFGLQLPAASGAALVGLFALFHGYAHGSEAAGFSFAYGAGLIVATLALHAFGLGIGFATRQPLLLRTAGGAIATVGLLLLIRL
jgi:urease accessory protein